MKASKTKIPDVLLIEPTVFTDSRGYFYESFNQKSFQESTGIGAQFVQDNHSQSVRGVLRGLHYQTQKPQGKLVRVTVGSVFCVVVDLRQSSATFKQWVSVEISAQSHQQMWIPAGFANGFLVLSETAELLYKTTNYYEPKNERVIAWNDETLAISWPLSRIGLQSPILSARDRGAESFSNSELFL